MSEWLKDGALVLFIIAVVIGTVYVLVDQTIGRPKAARLFAETFHLKLDLNDENVTVPTDQFRGVLVNVPYAGQVKLEVESLGGKNLDVHVISGQDLLRLANRKPPFAALRLNDLPAFEAIAATNVKRTSRLEAGSYVVVLEHSARGTAPTEVHVSVRLEP